MKTQTILDKFEAVSTTIHVLEKDDGDYFTFNEFGVVPVKCNIEYYWEPDNAVNDVFYVDTVTLDTSDDCITFDLADSTKEMLNPDDIISLEVTKISQHQYFKAIKQDKNDLDFFD
ncbi:hypothetical protein [uncultured Methanobrevibacter sp.]|uniref:hypothetical protein n=1 Tax=uncultured Methanobrevibacter sp. TaxID=253161 RepID=UPI0025D2D2E1|nr:hypothetical protein [uncultured Methanobrevibacter sp.]